MKTPKVMKMRQLTKLSTVAVRAIIENNPTNVLMDTEAGISVIDLETVRHLGLESYITQTVQNIYAVSGSNIKVIRIIEVSEKLGIVMCTRIIRVIESQTRNIIL